MILFVGGWVAYSVFVNDGECVWASERRCSEKTIDPPPPLSSMMIYLNNKKLRKTLIRRLWTQSPLCA